MKDKCWPHAINIQRLVKETRIKGTLSLKKMCLPLKSNYELNYLSVKNKLLKQNLG
jgi:hypothetical protein